jgi:hypothetical protein
MRKIKNKKIGDASLSGIIIPALLTFFVLLNTYARAQDNWKETFSYELPRGVIDKKWCGSEAVMLRIWDVTKWDRKNEKMQGDGGLVYINIAEKQKVWITKNPYIADPFCSHDGSKIFYYKWAGHPEEPIIKGLWVYDMKTRKEQKAGYGMVSGMQMKNPASPAGKIFILIGKGKIELPEWKLIHIPVDFKKLAVDREASKWAKDGSYFMLEFIPMLPIGESVKETISKFYDSGGNLFKSIKDGMGPILMKDGVYSYGRDGLKRFDPIDSHMERFPVQIDDINILKEFINFDISPTNEIVYSNNQGVWIDSIYGGCKKQVSKGGAGAIFSPTGEYIAYTTIGIGKDMPETHLVIVKR